MRVPYGKIEVAYFQAISKTVNTVSNQHETVEHQGVTTQDVNKSTIGQDERHGVAMPNPS